VRCSAAATIGVLLEGPAQRAFLGVAEVQLQGRSFTALSASLGQLVVAVHESLFEVCGAQVALWCLRERKLRRQCLSASLG
jgi:Domain of unknown function (DUF4042)